MKINYILPSIFKSGGIRIIFEYAEMLNKLGHDVCVYYPVIPQDFYRKKYSILRVKKYFRSLIDNFKNIYKKKYYDHNFKLKPVFFLHDFFIRPADYVIATAWPTAFFVNTLGKQKGIKIYFVQDYENWNANTDLVNESYKLPLHLITISEYLKNFFKTKFAVETFVIYNGLDKEKFFVECGRDDFKLKKILFIDHGEKKKNIAALIPIIEKIKEKYPDIEFVSFGLTNQTRKPEYVKFYENPNDNLIRKLYNEADLFIYPSLSEGFGLPPAEAMACKCAVASTAVGAVPEYVVDGVTGFIIKQNDLADLLEIIDNIKGDAELLRNVSENGYNKVREFFDWDKSIHKFIEYLTELNEP